MIFYKSPSICFLPCSKDGKVTLRDGKGSNNVIIHVHVKIPYS